VRGVRFKTRFKLSVFQEEPRSEGAGGDAGEEVRWHPGLRRVETIPELHWEHPEVLSSPAEGGGVARGALRGGEAAATWADAVVPRDEGRARR